MEVGVFGRDGMGSTAVALGSDQTPFAIFMQVAGSGFRIRAEHVRAAIEHDRSLHLLLLRYAQSVMVQVSQTALSNAVCTIEQRLARWLLMVHDRVDGDHIRLTHEFLSVMLGVRRTGLTLALHVLEGERMIKARRGVVTIIDRAKLLGVAGGAYGLAEAEYERLIGLADSEATADHYELDLAS